MTQNDCPDEIFAVPNRARSLAALRVTLVVRLVVVQEPLLMARTAGKRHR
jgi:hypothetical protein